MNAKETMATLKKMGTAQNVKVYRRHGAGNKLYGVSFADLNKLKKQIKTDHQLARQLWASGNTDARTLAIMVADPGQMTASEMDDWLSDISYYLLADLLGGLVAQSDLANRKLNKWAASKKEYVRQCGYVVLCSMLKDRAETVDDELCAEFLDKIERQIHRSPNRARHSMNMALTAIGIYKPRFRKKTISAARRIGKVEVDHGETSCKTPDAESYILKSAGRGRNPR